MFCDQCGAQLPDGATFCGKCGAKQNVAENTANPVVNAGEEPRKKKKGFPFIPVIIIGIVVVIGIVVAAFFLLNKKGNSGLTFSEKTLIHVYDNIIKINGEGFEADNISDIEYNYDKSVAAYLTDDNILYVIDSDLTPVEIEDDVYNMQVSYSGNTIAYTVGDDSTSVTLYVYNVKKNTSEKIETDVYAGNYVLSPNGKQIAYLTDYESSTDNTLYAATVGKEGKKVDKDGCVPIAINDNGKALFYVDGSDSSNRKLYLYNGKESEKISRNVTYTFYFNNTVSEVLFGKPGDTCYYRIGMSEPVKVANDELSDAWNNQLYFLQEDYDFCSFSPAVLLNRSSLKECIFVTDYDVMYLNKDCKDSVKLCSANISNISIAENEKSLLYLQGGTLYKVSKFGPDREVTVLYEGDAYITGYKASSDLSDIYVVTDDSEMYYVKSKNKLTKISNDFTDADDMALNESSGTIFYIEDDNLYSAGKNGKKKDLVMENVDTVVAFADGILFGTADEDERGIYYIGKKDPVKMYSSED